MSSFRLSSGGVSRPMRGTLISQIFPDDINSEGVLQLTIIFADENVNINELASYLAAIYKVDGLLHGKAYRSYVRTSSQQIEITKIRNGSVVLEIEKLLSSDGGYALCILWLFLKYLPQGILKALEAANIYYDVQNKREDYLEKKDKRRLRRDIKQNLTDTPELNTLTEADKAKLTRLLGELYEANASKLNAIIRFSEKYVKSLRLSKRRQ